MLNRSNASNRQSRKELAQDTLETLERGWYETENGERVDIADEVKQAVANTIIYTPQKSRALQGNRSTTSEKNPSPTEIVVNGLTTLDAARSLAAEGEEDIFCLNFASGCNPGGGFLNGSQAQEESIARASAIHPCQNTNEARELYYNANREAKAPFYTETMIYSPQVPVFKNEDGIYMEKPLSLSILTAPAVNASVWKNKKSPVLSGDKLQQIENAMKQRVAKVLAIANHHHHDVLVLGAWGCGVFSQDPADVARWFRQALQKYQFRRVIFAVYSPSREDDQLCRSAMQFCEEFKIQPQVDSR